MDSIWKRYRNRITNKDKNATENENNSENVVDKETENTFEEYINTDWQKVFFNTKKENELELISEKTTVDANKKMGVFEAIVSKTKIKSGHKVQTYL